MEVDVFLRLVRLGLGTSTEASLPEQTDWDAIEVLAKQQGLWGVLFDGVGNLSQNYRPPQVTWLRWIGEVMQGYEQRYELYQQAIAKLAAFYNSHGYKMMLLKGYACSMNWPKPEHRPCGDIDIWQFGQYKRADKDLTQEFGVRVDHSHQHHTVFQWQGFTVENHFDFVNVYAHRSSRELEKTFKRLGGDDTHAVEVLGHKVYLPSPNLHALFLLRHAMAHFAAKELTLRQMIDWTFFVEKQGSGVDWSWLLNVLDNYHMRDFFNCLNAICMEDLGFSGDLFPNLQLGPSMKNRVVEDILSPAFTGAMPKQLFPRVVWKYRRWKANEWKRELCYKESKSAALWSGVKNHLLKPASI